MRLAFLIAVALLCATGSAAAEPQVVLQWDAPTACPTQSEATAAVERYLHGPLDQPDRSKLAIRVTVTGSTRRGWTLELQLETTEGTGERSLRGRNCTELVESAALIIALAIDPNALAAAPPQDPPPQAPPPPQDPPPQDPPATDSEVPAALYTADQAQTVVRGEPSGAWGPLLWSFRASATGGSDTGLGLAGAVTARHGRGLFEVSLARWIGRRVPKEQGATQGAEFTGMTVAGRGCWRFRPYVCAGAEFTRLEGTAYGITDPSSGSAWWLGGLAGVADGIQLTEIMKLWGRFEVIAPMQRPRFVAGGVGELYQVPIVSVRAAVGVEVQFR